LWLLLFSATIQASELVDAKAIDEYIESKMRLQLLYQTSGLPMLREPQLWTATESRSNRAKTHNKCWS